MEDEEEAFSHPISQSPGFNFQLIKCTFPISSCKMCRAHIELDFSNEIERVNKYYSWHCRMWSDKMHAGVMRSIDNDNIEMNLFCATSYANKEGGEGVLKGGNG